ncbi:MAG: hypothetical protein AAF959_27925 [Cyanobacteria bacterium P01_D01_bin.56]
MIVEEAHTCVFAGEGRGGKQQWHQLIKGLADKPLANQCFEEMEQIEDILVTRCQTLITMQEDIRDLINYFESW